MQMTNESTVNFKPKKKPRNKLYPVKKNLNRVFLTRKTRTAEEERIGVTRQSESIRLKQTITMQDWAMRRALEDQKNRHHLPPDEYHLKMIALFDKIDCGKIAAHNREYGKIRK